MDSKTKVEGSDPVPYDLRRVTTVFHIPHSSVIIPDFTGFTDLARVTHEVNLLTDWATADIFEIEGVDSVIAGFSRIFCDVERLDDAVESMFQKGRGMCYTHTDDGHLLRQLTPELKQHIVMLYYDRHHQSLTTLVRQKLNQFGYANIIDCHSFSDIPLISEDNQSLARPDICLGTDTYHTPESMTIEFTALFQRHGLSVALNMPYAGTIVPLSMYQRNPAVRSIMIEINKRLYMNETTLVVDHSKVLALNRIIRSLFTEKP